MLGRLILCVEHAAPSHPPFGPGCTSKPEQAGLLPMFRIVLGVELQGGVPQAHWVQLRVDQHTGKHTLHAT